MMKNCDLSLENAALGQYFQDLGHSFSPYGPPSQQITYMYFTHYLTQELKELNLTSAVQYVNVRALFLRQYSWGT